MALGPALCGAPMANNAHNHGVRNLNSNDLRSSGPCNTDPRAVLLEGSCSATCPWCVLCVVQGAARRVGRSAVGRRTGRAGMQIPEVLTVLPVLTCCTGKGVGPANVVVPHRHNSHARSECQEWLGSRPELDALPTKLLPQQLIDRLGLEQHWSKSH